jgi:hypothetical protein
MYNFIIEFNPYSRLNGGLNDTRTIYVSGICIVAKNQKFGKAYHSPYIKHMDGSFAKVAGSNSYPLLWPVVGPKKKKKRGTVTLHIKGFPRYPKFDLDQKKCEEYYPHITIKNITKI